MRLTPVEFLSGMGSMVDRGSEADQQGAVLCASSTPLDGEGVF